MFRVWHLFSRPLGIVTSHFFESISIVLEKFGLKKKSPFWSQKFSVSEKRLGIGLKNIWSKKNSRCRSQNIWIQSLSIGLKRFVLKKVLMLVSKTLASKKVLVFHIFQNRKLEWDLLLIKFYLCWYVQVILCLDFVSWSVSIAVSKELASGLVLIHCQRLNRPKALRTFTHSAPLVRSWSFNKVSVSNIRSKKKSWYQSRTV